MTNTAAAAAAATSISGRCWEHFSGEERAHMRHLQGTRAIADAAMPGSALQFFEHAWLAVREFGLNTTCYEWDPLPRGLLAHMEPGWSALAVAIAVLLTVLRIRMTQGLVVWNGGGGGGGGSSGEKAEKSGGVEPAREAVEDGTGDDATTSEASTETEAAAAADRFDDANLQRLAESIWKFTAYTLLWTLSFYVVYWSGRHDIFQRPLRLWENWTWVDDDHAPAAAATSAAARTADVTHHANTVPADIRLMYLTQLAFYLHSAYATLRLDPWRADSLLMLAHHVITLLLIYLSLLARYHRIGALVLLLHDISDVFLEFGKINLCLKRYHLNKAAAAATAVAAGTHTHTHAYKQPAQFHVYRLAAFLAYLLFSSSWALCRLYWYPAKVLYSTTWGVYVFLRGRNLKMFSLFNVLLLMLFMMHVLWYYFILVLLVKILSGELSDIEDVRDEDVPKEQPRRSSSVSESPAVSNSSPATATDGPPSNNSIPAGDRTQLSNGNTSRK